MELIIKRAQKGDKEAFIQLMDKYTQDMYKVAKSRLNSEEDVGDAIQETILSTYKNIYVLKNVDYFKTWLMRILINKCNDIIANNKKVVYVEEYYDGSISNEVLEDKDNLENNIAFREILKKLNESYRTVIILYYVSGFNTREISEILNEKEGTIKSRLSRAREKLKEYYLKDDSSNNFSDLYLGGSVK